MTRRIASLAAVLALVMVAPVRAQDMSPHLPGMPGQPIISGNVVSSTDHSVTVQTDDGEQILFDIDSRSMLPSSLNQGMPVRVEFHLMDSGRYLAKRITPIRNGEMGTTETSERVTPNDEEMNERSDMNHGEGMAPNASDESMHHENAMAQEQNNNASEQRTSTENNPNATTTDENETHHGEELPRTASSRPLLEGIGMIAFAAGASLWWYRRRRSA